MHLSDFMTKRKLSDETVAAAIGRSRVSVSRYRRRLIRPDWDAIEEIRAYSKGAVTAQDWTGPLADEPSRNDNDEPKRAAKRA